MAIKEWNAGQGFTAAAGTFQAAGNIMSAIYSSKGYRAEAKSYEQQMLQNYSSYMQNIRYMGEQNLSRISSLLDEGRSLLGEQMVASAASMMDISSGDQRVFKDTKAKISNEIYLANRANYLKSHELYVSTMAENAYLAAAAKSARRNAKYASILGGINTAAGLAQTAAGVYYYGKV